MKRLLLFSIVCMLAIASSAQTEHVKFMGIPIDGTINQFQQKLQAKGIKYNQALSRLSPNGSRVFDGKHEGDNACITVIYNVNTKIVYSVGVVYVYNTPEAALEKFKQIADSLNEKYVFDEEGSDDEKLRFLVPAQDLSRVIGIVNVSCDYHCGTFKTCVIYCDLANYILNDENQ